MTDFAIHWILAHQQFFVGAATGYAVAHIPEATLAAFHLAMRIPWFRAAILANPEKAKSIARAIEKAIEQGIDQEAVTKAASAADIPHS